MADREHLHESRPRAPAHQPAAGSSRSAASASAPSRSRSLLGSVPAQRRCGRSASPIRSPRSRRTSRRRPSASSTCSWPARRATSSCSTTSRSSPSSTASCRRPELLKGYRAAFINPNSTLLGPKFKFARHGQSRRRALRAAAAPGRGRRRHRHRQVDGDRRVQPRPGADLHEHRLAAVRPAEHGRVGRPTASAASRRTCPAFVVFSTGQKGPSGGAVELGLRLPADRLPGRPVPRPGRPGPVPLEPAGRRRRDPARLARRHPQR